MNFDQFIKKLPQLKKAGKEDNERILAFMQRTKAQKRFTLFYDRSPDFFSLLQLSSPYNFVLLYEGKLGELEGIISYTLIKGKDFDILYMGDLKIKASSDATKTNWRNFAEEFIEKINEMEEFKNVKYVYMVMMDDNTKAYQRLVASNILSFNIKKFQSYKMINILGQKWWNFSSSSRELTHHLRQATSEEMNHLLQHSAQNKWGADHPEFIKYRAEKMKDNATIFEITNKQGEILLSATLEDVSPAKRILIKRLPIGLKLFTKALPLIKGKAYSEGSSLDILYLSNLSFHFSIIHQQKKMWDVINYALKTALNFSNKRYHVISLSLFENDFFFLPNIKKYFLTQIEPLGHYQVIPTWGEEIPSNINPNFNMSYI